MSVGREELISRVVDSGFLPPPRRALAAVAEAVRILAARLEERASTLDGLLLEVSLTFNQLVSEIVYVAELPETARPRDGVPLTAALHAVAIVDTLTFLGGASDGCADAAAEDGLRRRWTETVIGLCYAREPMAWSLSANSYVRITSGQLSFAGMVLQANQRISLEPENRALAVRPTPSLAKSLDPDAPELAARCMAWCSAAAMCLAACVSRDFDLDRQASRT
jgi:hypothetical protein